jgi:cell division septum initiation protein DivIVA
MRATLAFAAVAFCLAGATAESGAGTRVQVTPVQKVLELMNGMLAQGKDEKHAEEVQYAAFKQFCEDTTVEKKQLIEEANQKIEKLKADIEQYAADAAQLTKEIAKHEEDIAAWTADIKAATSVRAAQKADYDLAHKDYSESISALERAIDVLKKESYDRKQAASLVQVANLKQLTLIPPEAKRAIDAFLAQGSEATLSSGTGAPEAYGYEFQSAGIIEMLDKLLDKFVAERTQFEKEEANAKNAYVMLKTDLEGSITQATQDVNEKTATKAKKLEAKAAAEADLADTTATRDADVKYLDDLTATCSKKATDFEARQTLRAEEIVAIEKAIEIISSAAVAGNSDTYLPTMLQTRKKGKTSFAQFNTVSQDVNRARAISYLQQRAKQLGSKVLSTLAVKAADDPFVKVKKMIKDLIVRLMEEANEEAEHKGWCDTELTTNEQTRKEKTEAVETLRAEIDELEASIQKLTEEIATLTKAVADLDAAMATATKLRQEEKATNLQTIKDAKEAQAAVAQALAVLKDFYAKAGDATALVQQQPVAPEVFDSPYKGLQSKAGGVVGFLETIESDFARLEAETAAAEETAQTEYDGFMTDSQVDKDSKVTDIEHKTTKKQDESTTLGVKNSDLDGTQKELDAALAYFDKLKPSCVDAGVSYDSRVGRREEEIQSLKEALAILNGKEIP